MDTPTIIKHYRGKTPLRNFAEQIGVSHAAVQQWESGTTEPTDERITAWINDQRGWVSDMGRMLFLARNGQTLKNLIK